MEQNKEGDGFVRFRWGETKAQDAVGAARLTIEIGAEFPIGITAYETGIEVSNAELVRTKMTPATFHGEWNYTIRPLK